MQIPTYRCNLCGSEWTHESPDPAPRMVGLKRSGGKWKLEDVAVAREHLCFECFGSVAALHHTHSIEEENRRLSEGARRHPEPGNYNVLSGELTLPNSRSDWG